MLEEAAVSLGLERGVAARLVLQTALGAARMMLESGGDPAGLREQVTSPGGTTMAALRVMDEGGFRELFRRAVQAAAQRSRELASQS